VGKRGPLPQPTWLKQMKGSRIRRKPAERRGGPVSDPVVMPAEIPTAYDRWCFYFDAWIACKKALDAEGTF
jgi:hypothetical protein